MEKLQNRALRVALGYRNSTPLNVMTTETKVLKVEDRANFLAKNFWNKIICNNDRETERKMNRLDILMCQNRFILPKGSIFMM